MKISSQRTRQADLPRRKKNGKKGNKTSVVIKYSVIREIDEARSEIGEEQVDNIPVVASPRDLGITGGIRPHLSTFRQFEAISNGNLLGKRQSKKKKISS